ncbi:MAG: hypothetical protein HPY81_06415 [Firmicutes bacterium]|nr:hypothetical protein [Bacillota bacterium]
MNRLIAPQSKLRVSEWAKEDVYEPRFSYLQLHHYHRSLDFLAQHKESLKEQLFFQGRDLFNQTVDPVFFDTTTFTFAVPLLAASGMGTPTNSTSEKERVLENSLFFCA